MPINAELSARIYNLTINDDTAARATPDGGVEVRRTTLPRDQAFPQVVIATADKDGNVTTIEGNTDGQGSREGGAVLKKRRHLSKIRSRIRFTI